MKWFKFKFKWNARGKNRINNGKNVNFFVNNRLLLQYSVTMYSVNNSDIYATKSADFGFQHDIEIFKIENFLSYVKQLKNSRPKPQELQYETMQ